LSPVLLEGRRLCFGMSFYVGDGHNGPPMFLVEEK